MQPASYRAPAVRGRKGVTHVEKGSCSVLCEALTTEEPRMARSLHADASWGSGLGSVTTGAVVSGALCSGHSP